MTTTLLDRPTPIDDATRLGRPLSRRLLLAGTATLGLTACGGSTTEAPLPTGSAGFPLTLLGKEGTTTS